jgi:hypothetical protein
VALIGNKLGALLTDGQGRTLYLFEKDQAGVSARTATCLAVWPALTTTGGVQAGPGLPTSKLSPIRRGIPVTGAAEWHALHGARLPVPEQRCNQLPPAWAQPMCSAMHSELRAASTHPDGGGDQGSGNQEREADRHRGEAARC